MEKHTFRGRPQEIQESQLMLTTGAMHLAVTRGQQTWYHFGSVATFTCMHSSALHCLRSHSRSIWNMANLTPL